MGAFSHCSGPEVIRRQGTLSSMVVQVKGSAVTFRFFLVRLYPGRDES